MNKKPVYQSDIARLMEKIRLASEITRAAEINIINRLFMAGKLNKGKHDITAEWLAVAMNILTLHAQETLRGLYGRNELEIQSEIKTRGKAKRIYRTTETFKRGKVIEVSPEQAVLNIQHVLCGWQPNTSRFFSLRDSA